MKSPSSSLARMGTLSSPLQSSPKMGAILGGAQSLAGRHWLSAPPVPSPQWMVQSAPTTSNETLSGFLPFHQFTYVGPVCRGSDSRSQSLLYSLCLAFVINCSLQRLVSFRSLFNSLADPGCPTLSGSAPFRSKSVAPETALRLVVLFLLLLPRAGPEPLNLTMA